jgi:hypothetical protein
MEFESSSQNTKGESNFSRNSFATALSSKICREDGSNFNENL